MTEGQPVYLDSSPDYPSPRPEGRTGKLSTARLFGQAPEGLRMAISSTIPASRRRPLEIRSSKSPNGPQVVTTYERYNAERRVGPQEFAQRDADRLSLAEVLLAHAPRVS